MSEYFPVWLFIRILYLHEHREDWGLDDPSVQADEIFLETIRLIEENVLDLRERLK